MNEGIVQRSSGKKGIGIFAVRNFVKDELVYSFFQGKLLNKKYLMGLSDEERKYIDKVGDELYEIIESPAQFVNHSCNPNVVERNHVGYGLRNIQSGEEITIDYEAVEYVGPVFECCCSESNCRKHIPS